MTPRQLVEQLNAELAALTPGSRAWIAIESKIRFWQRAMDEWAHG